MRKEYSKVLRAAFDTGMADALPEYVPTKVQSKFAFPGERYYCRSAGDRLRLWVALVPSPKQEEFTIEVGWSRLGRFPELPARPPAFGLSADRAEFAKDEYFARLPRLWSDDDPWWVVEAFDANDIMGSIMQAANPVPAERARQKVLPLVQDAIDKLRTHGVPYLYEFEKATS